MNKPLPDTSLRTAPLDPAAGFRIQAPLLFGVMGRIGFIALGVGLSGQNQEIHFPRLEEKGAQQAENTERVGFQEDFGPVKAGFGFPRQGRLV